MSDAIRQHVIRYPQARTSTVRYLAAREEMTKRLMQEVLDEQRRRTPKPWWSRIDWLPGIWRW